MDRAPGAETTALTAANYIVWRCQMHGDTITNLKLQKMLYYAQGWFLAFYDRPLFSDSLRAWIRGPVQYEVWQSFNHYRWEPITKKVRKPAVSTHAQVHLDDVIKVYGDISAYTLERMTHGEPPWIRARGSLRPDQRSTAVISLDDMKAYFLELANEPES